MLLHGQFAEVCFVRNQPRNRVVQFMLEIPNCHWHRKKLSVVENDGYNGGPVCDLALDGGSII